MPGEDDMTIVKRGLVELLAAALAALVVLVLGSSLAGCASQGKGGTARDRIAATPAMNLKNYTFDPASPLADRIQPPPAFVLKHLQEVDGRDDYAAYEPTEADRALTLQYLDLLPAWFDAMLKDRLVGIYFAEHLVGTAFTEFVLDKADKVHAFIAIDPAALHTGLSEWMTAREASCFSGAAGTDADAPSVFVDCGTTYQALLYALVHECGHVADYVYHYTPYVEPLIQEIGLGVPGTDFVKNIWSEYARPEERADFTGRTDVTFYSLGGGPKIPIADAAGLYQLLANSPFPSLYAAQNWAEDFAECFTWYFFTDRLGERYQVGLRRGGAVEAAYEPIYWSRVVHRFPQLDPVVQDARK
jgi:hypothetical protein